MYPYYVVMLGVHSVYQFLYHKLINCQLVSAAFIHGAFCILLFQVTKKSKK